MKNRNLLTAAACSLVLTGLPATGAGESASGETPRKPNVLFIAVDDLNDWVTHFGANPQAQTPNIDRLAGRGVTFTRAYCAAPVCLPSRTALMGGERPGTTGCYDLGSAGDFIPKGASLNAQFLKAGYHVAGAGKIYHGSFKPSEWTEYMKPASLKDLPKPGKDEGFLEPVVTELQDDQLGDWHSVDWCIKQLEANHDKPFFIGCGLIKPHLPFAVPRKYYDMFPRDSIQLPPYLADDLSDVPPIGQQLALAHGDHEKILAADRWKDAIQAYLAASAYTDMNVGRLLDALDKSPARDNTIVVLWSDHGWSFGQKDHWRKSALWEEQNRVPLIWVAPGVTRPGGVCDRTVDYMSIYPTLCELAGLPVPPHVEGASIVPLLRDPKAEWTLPAITTFRQNNHAIRNEDWRYIRYADGTEELYDMKGDPNQWTNLADRPGAPAEAKAALAKFLPTVNKPEPATKGGKRKARHEEE